MKVTKCKDLLSKLDQVDTQNCWIVGKSFAVIFEGNYQLFPITQT